MNSNGFKADLDDMHCNIEFWMTRQYGLKGAELLLFALIYNLTLYGGQNGWYGSLKTAEELTQYSTPAILKAYKSLEERGMVRKENVMVGKVRTCRYTALVGKKEKTRSDNGQGVNKSADDNDCIPQSNEHYQVECQSEDEYYSSLADCVTNSEEFGQCQETLFDDPEEPKQEPKPKKANKYEAEIKEVIEFLNSKTGGRHKPTNKQTIKDLTRWFKQGYIVEDIKRMISFKCNQWLNDQKMRDYLAPKTLFRLSNFEGYMEASQGYQDFVSDAERGCINV